MDSLPSLVYDATKTQRESMRIRKYKGELAKLSKWGYVFVARDEFLQGGKLWLSWRGPRRVIKALNDYSFQVEDFRNGNLEVVHGTSLKFSTTIIWIKLTSFHMFCHPKLEFQCLDYYTSAK